MNDLEINSMADGLLAYLREHTPSPIDALSVLGIAIIKHHEHWAGVIPFAKFADDFHQGLIETQANQSAEGNRTRN